MPRLSDSMEEGTIVRWIVADGEQISVGDELVEIETDKATMAYEAEDSGILRIVAAEGAVVAVGATIGHIGDGSLPESAVAEPRASVGAATGPRRPVAAKAPAVGSNGANRPKASPLARRIAAALGVDLALLNGSGPQGRIVKRDVEAMRRQGAPVPFTSVQATIARRMVEAKQAPEFTLTMEVDMEAAVAVREQLGALRERPPSLGDFVIKACALALREHPEVNASYTGDGLEPHPRVNIGVAVAAPGALYVPTVFDADSKPLEAIAEEVRALAGRARAGQLTPPEVSGATFTVSNLGMYGVSHFTAVINPPQAAILAVGTVEQRAVAVDGRLAVRQGMTMTISCDHRVIYGADAAAFMASVRDNLEQPLRLVL